MRCWRVTVLTVACCLLIAGTVAGTDDAGPTDPNARRDEVVALVLAQDARFADLPDHRRQEIKYASEFSMDALIGSGYYRVLPTVTTQWSDSTGVDLFAFREPRNWLVEVVLVRGCVPVVGGQAIQPPLPDPCAWRHAWYYRVQSDDTVTLLFEEGDPDPALAGEGSATDTSGAANAAAGRLAMDRLRHHRLPRGAGLPGAGGREVW